MSNDLKIDFDTMRVNCIQIHQEVTELIKVADHIGYDLRVCVKTADELRTHNKTKSWDGMGKFAKELHDETRIWNALPETLTIASKRILWNKAEAKAMLLDCYFSLGGYKLDK